MRELSKSEKFIVDIIIEWDERMKTKAFESSGMNITGLFRCLADKMDARFQLHTDYGKKSVEVFIHRTENQRVDYSKLMNFRKELITAVYFIHYLNSEKLVYLLPNSTSDINSYPEKNKEAVELIDFISDLEFNTRLSELMGNFILPTEFLINYKKRGYKTPEELRFEETMNTSILGVKMAKRALYVTIAVGIIQIIIALVSNGFIMDFINSFRELALN
jgi:hypothetical protein